MGDLPATDSPGLPGLHKRASFTRAVADVVASPAHLVSHVEGMLQSLFEVFAAADGRMPVGLFMTLFGYLAARDAEISGGFVDELQQDLNVRGATELTFPELIANPLVAQLCDKLG